MGWELIFAKPHLSFRAEGGESPSRSSLYAEKPPVLGSFVPNCLARCWGAGA